jgi:hypothetical protein
LSDWRKPGELLRRRGQRLRQLLFQGGLAAVLEHLLIVTVNFTVTAASWCLTG